LKIANFPYPFSFTAIGRGDPFRICRKPLQILVAESVADLTVKISWSQVVSLW